MSAAPQVLLLDMMDTVVHEVFVRQVPAFFGMSLDELIDLKTPEVWVEFEKGRASQAQYLETFFKDGRRFDHEAFLAHIKASYEFIDGMEDLLARWSERVPIHVLSNYPIWYRWIEERLQVSRYCAWSFVSCHTGVRKPHPEAYLGPARHLEVPPAECLFIDDRQDNCDAARALGMPAVQFVSATQLDEALTAHFD